MFVRMCGHHSAPNRACFSTKVLILSSSLTSPLFEHDVFTFFSGHVQDMQEALSIEAGAGVSSLLSTCARETLFRCQRMVPALAKIPSPISTEVRGSGSQQQRSDAFIPPTSTSETGEVGLTSQNLSPKDHNNTTTADAANGVHAQTFGGSLKTSGGKMTTGAGQSNGDALDGQSSLTHGDTHGEGGRNGSKTCGYDANVKDGSCKNKSSTGAEQEKHTVQNTLPASPEKTCGVEADPDKNSPGQVDREATTRSALLVAENLKTDGNVKFAKGFYSDAIQDYKDALDMLVKTYVATTPEVVELQNVCRMNIAASALKKSVGLKREKEAAEVLETAVTCCNDVLQQDQTR
jgi:hypothetical protein